MTHDLNEEVYKETNARGLVIPFRQMTVHLANPTEQNAD